METFPNNCAIMFPQAPSSAESLFATFQLVSYEDDDNDNPSTEGSVDSSQAPPCPLVMGMAVLTIHRLSPLHGGLFNLSSN